MEESSSNHDDDEFNSAHGSLRDVYAGNFLDDVPFIHTGTPDESPGVLVDTGASNSAPSNQVYPRASTVNPLTEARFASSRNQSEASGTWTSSNLRGPHDQSSSPRSEIEIVFLSEDDGDDEGDQDRSYTSGADDSFNSFYTPKYDWFLPDHAGVDCKRRKPLTTLAERLKHTTEKHSTYSIFPQQQQQPHSEQFYECELRHDDDPLRRGTTTALAIRQSPYAMDNFDDDDDDEAHNQFSVISDDLSRASDAVDDLLVFCATSEQRPDDGILPSLFRLAGF
eukprot:CAMPEP_0198128566 /NCGR_PEP_ID=MMETSP1442-20131203/49662_1 /TAXON_ID= /ORGANISM="Craspedostauros australis, Strain CCMP3328" /LENGTH=280 /DNA_ID=CAMNT_0043788759 /DNA_START=8 /DNA_END=850 /DNA_ORIENTATION=+